MSLSKDDIEILKKLLDKIHFARNIIEHKKKIDGVSAVAYSYEIHLIESDGRKIFNENFPFKDYKTYFFESLQVARSYAHDDTDARDPSLFYFDPNLFSRDFSLYYMKFAENYVREVIIKLG